MVRPFGMSDTLNIHFGLGTAESIDRLIIRWPSGIVQTIDEVAADQLLMVTEPVD
jgi:hypothetical protein